MAPSSLCIHIHVFSLDFPGQIFLILYLFLFKLNFILLVCVLVVLLFKFIRAQTFGVDISKIQLIPSCYNCNIPCLHYFKPTELTHLFMGYICICGFHSKSIVKNITKILKRAWVLFCEDILSFNIRTIFYYRGT